MYMRFDNKPEKSDGEVRVENVLKQLNNPKRVLRYFNIGSEESAIVSLGQRVALMEKVFEKIAEFDSKIEFSRPVIQRSGSSSLRCCSPYLSSFLGLVDQVNLFKKNIKKQDLDLETNDHEKTTKNTTEIKMPGNSNEIENEKLIEELKSQLLSKEAKNKKLIEDLESQVKSSEITSKKQMEEFESQMNSNEIKSKVQIKELESQMNEIEIKSKRLIEGLENQSKSNEIKWKKQIQEFDYQIQEKDIKNKKILEKPFENQMKENEIKNKKQLEGLENQLKSERIKSKKQIEELESQLKQQNESLYVQMDEKEKLIEKLQLQIQAIKCEKQNADNSFEKLGLEISTLLRKISEVDNERQKAIASLHETENQALKNKHEMGLLRNQVKNMEAVTSNRIMEVYDGKAHLEVQYKILESDLKYSELIANDLKTRISHLEKELDDNEEKLFIGDENFETVLRDELRMMKSTYESRLKDAQTQQSNLKKMQNLEIAKLISDHNATIFQADSQIRTLKAQLR